MTWAHTSSVNSTNDDRPNNFLTNSSGLLYFLSVQVFQKYLEKYA